MDKVECKYLGLDDKDKLVELAHTALHKLYDRKEFDIVQLKFTKEQLIGLLHEEDVNYFDLEDSEDAPEAYLIVNRW
jgi:hypothetical protein